MGAALAAAARCWWRGRCFGGVAVFVVIGSKRNGPRGVNAEGVNIKRWLPTLAVLVGPVGGAAY